MKSARQTSRGTRIALLSAILVIFAFDVVPAMSAEKVLHVFQGGTDGLVPQGALIADNAGDLYGTTDGGGGGTNCFEGDTYGCGTVYEITAGGTESVLHAFKGGCDGSDPFGGMVRDKQGNLYGTTATGGICNSSAGNGTIFKLTPGGTESVLYAFQGGSDGSVPIGSLISDKDGNLYGATQGGGAFSGADCANVGCGTVFELKPDGTRVTLYTFQGGTDGAVPFAGLIADTNGNLYGTTVEGGNLAECSPSGCGVVFKVAADGSESALYTFQGGADGAAPRSTLIADTVGNLYGTVTFGGNVQSCRPPGGCGAVFKFAPDGTESVLYAFNGGSDGAIPYAGVTMDKSGNLYGTTYYGGSTACHGNGCGTVFNLAPDGTETVLHAFKRLNKGRMPAASLLLKSGILYGTATAGGTSNNGVVFSVRK